MNLYLGLPLPMQLACQRRGVLPTRWCLVVSVARQRMALFESQPRVSLTHSSAGADASHRQFGAPEQQTGNPRYLRRREYIISTSKYGIGQRQHSNCTPLGLHRIAEKHGGGYPVGAVFKSRKFQGYTWQGLPQGEILHRILWLEGLEPGFNRGGAVDTYARFIYLHGFGDGRTLGRPASHGCIHLAPDDLMPLFNLLPTGTLVWIGRD